MKNEDKRRRCQRLLISKQRINHTYILLSQRGLPVDLISNSKLRVEKSIDASFLSILSEKNILSCKCRSVIPPNSFCGILIQTIRAKDVDLEHRSLALWMHERRRIENERKETTKMARELLRRVCMVCTTAISFTPYHFYIFRSIFKNLNSVHTVHLSWFFFSFHRFQSWNITPKEDIFNYSQPININFLSLNDSPLRKKKHLNLYNFHFIWYDMLWISIEVKLPIHSNRSIQFQLR